MAKYAYTNKKHSRKACKRLMKQLLNSGRYKRVWAEYDPLDVTISPAIRWGVVMVEDKINHKEASS